MKSFTEFSNALEEWRNYGGAMSYSQPVGNIPGVWFVGEYQEIEEINENVTPKIQTEIALEKGGLSRVLIEMEMEYWHD